jgi:hypothetical protein
VLLPVRLRIALWKLNPRLPNEAIEEPLRKVTGSQYPSLIANDHNVWRRNPGPPGRPWVRRCAAKRISRRRCRSMPWWSPLERTRRHGADRPHHGVHLVLGDVQVVLRGGYTITATSELP